MNKSTCALSLKSPTAATVAATLGVRPRLVFTALKRVTESGMTDREKLHRAVEYLIPIVDIMERFDALDTHEERQEFAAEIAERYRHNALFLRITEIRDRFAEVDAVGL